MTVYLGAVEKRKFYWVIGKFPNLRITTNRPRGKMVREPFESQKAAQRFIQMEFLMND